MARYAAAALMSLMAIEDKVRKAEKTAEGKAVETRYEALQKQRRPYQRSPGVSLGDRVKAAVNNVRNVALNAFDNTAGYGIAQYQNYRTKSHFRKDPGSKKDIAYLMHGLMQNEGSQWRLARQMRKAGMQPYHLKGNHHLPRKESAEQGFAQIRYLHKETKLKNPRERKDSFSGHSSGADVGLYMAGDERMREYGIRQVQARAPAPYGVKAETFGQKVLLPLAKESDLETMAGKREAVEMADRKPRVKVHVVAGKYDRLVPPKDTVYMLQDKSIRHYVIDHKDSTHFGTSGVNKGMNELFIGLLKTGKEKYHHGYRAAA